MVTEPQRRLVKRLLEAGAFTAQCGTFGLIQIHARWGFRWLLRRLKQRQIVDNLHHAPACPANHYHKMRLVFRPCTCGAYREMYSQASGGAVDGS